MIKEIAFLRDSTFIQFAYESLPTGIAGQLKVEIDRIQEPILLFQHKQEYWIFTEQLFARLSNKSIARYPIAEITALGLAQYRENVLEFTHGAKRVLIPASRQLLDWLHQHGVAPRYATIQCRFLSKSYMELSFSLRQLIETALGKAEIPELIFFVNDAGWVCTQSAIIDLRKKPYKRYDYDRIRGFFGKSGWWSHRFLFRYDAQDITFTKEIEEIWAFLEKWPNVVGRLLIADYELSTSDSDSTKNYNFGCQVDMQYVRTLADRATDAISSQLTVKANITYAKATARVPIWRGGEMDCRLQKVRCPHCGASILLEVFEGGLVVLNSKDDRQVSFSPYRFHSHVPWNSKEK
jgi:hypothetical protein